MKVANLSVEEIRERLVTGFVEPQLCGVEFKESWGKNSGKDISAIANSPQILRGWLLVGVNDRGELTGRDLEWAKGQEAAISSQVIELLQPTFAVHNIIVLEVKNSYCVAIEIANPGDVVYWGSRAYKLVGTASPEMAVDEILALSLKLPGADFSKGKNQQETDPSLVIAFAQKVNAVANEDFHIDLAQTTPREILAKFNIQETNVAAILFGDFKFRFVHFDEAGDILDQKSIKGLYRLLSDSFVDEIQSWTRRQGTNLRGSTVSATEEVPYPPKALREILANAVAHALYQRDQGDIVVELHPNRITIRNNCSLEAKAFINKWLSRYHKTFHKHLMNTLRVAQITDEQGSGKIRIFKHMLENGKREPLIDFEDLRDYGRWSITLFNEESNAPLKGIFARLLEIYGNQEKARVAQALLLWREKPWSEIQLYLDEGYKHIANEVLNHKDCPVLQYDDRIYTRRWAKIALEGQVTKEFSEAEKNGALHMLKSLTSQGNRGGFISSEEAKKIMGLSNTKQESGQIGKLFNEWKKRGLVKKIKNGQWQFL